MGRRGYIYGYMRAHRHTRRFVVWTVADSVIILVAYMTAFSARAIFTPLDYVQVLDFTLFSIVVTLLSLHIFGVYRRIWSQTSGHSIVVIVKAVAVSTAVTFAVDVVAGAPHPLPLSVVLLGNFLAFTGFVAVRYRSRLISGLSWRLARDLEKRVS
ncbi:MAG: hypothetical protein M5R40_21835 [Anaerolineae bacterium]|nr:hypothetical protein [Anaerolineae bacterium]